MSQNPDILEAGDAVSSLMFKKTEKDNAKWAYEFIIVTYSGLLKAYNISATHGYAINYEFSYGNFYRNGVNAFAYDHKHDLYIVAGNNIMQSLKVSSIHNLLLLEINRLHSRIPKPYLM